MGGVREKLDATRSARERRETMRRRLVATIHGIVQGVSFRESTRRVATALSVTGSVRNQVDGTVLVIAEGEGEALHDLLLWLERGPEHAAVDRVDAEWTDPLGAGEAFRVIG